MRFKQFLKEYTDWTKEYGARHQKKHGLLSGFVNKPRKSFNLIAQYRKDKLAVNPNIQQLKEMGGSKICSASDLSYIRETYPQLNLAELGPEGKALGKTGIVIRKQGNQYIISKQQ